MEHDWSGLSVPPPSISGLISESDAESDVRGSRPIGPEVGPVPGPLLDRPSRHRSRDASGDGDSKDGNKARLIVVMGVSGTGKSTLGKALAGCLGLPFVDGDDLHPATNVAKMARGEPLDDVDRWPWLERIRGWAVECVGAQVRAGDGTGAGMGMGMGTGEREQRRLGVVVACSALKRAYRAVLRGESAQGAAEGPMLDTCFVYLKGERGVLTARMQSRRGHFMKVGMLDSQLEALESPEGEAGVVTVSVEMSTEEQVKTVVRKLLS